MSFLIIILNNIIIPLNRLEEMWGYATILFATTCNYVSFLTTFATTYQLFHQNLGRICDYITINVQLLTSSSSYVMFLGLYSSMNKLQWPISCVCNQNLIANWCIMYIMGMIHIHIWGCTIKNSIYIIINKYLWMLSTYL